jgi:hypothetical protein
MMRRFFLTAILALLPIAACGGEAADGVHVGARCSSDAQCSSDGSSQCATRPIQVTPTSPSAGFLLPDPVCIATGCTRPASGVPFCAGVTGYCFEPYPNASTTCLPLCTYRESTGVVGCVGADACQLRYTDVTAGLVAYGTCYFGCSSDADCGQGMACQREYGSCVSTLNTFPGAIGTPCTIADDGVLCNCLWSSAGTGYCAPACVTGQSACPAGFACDVGLAAVTATGQTLFSAAPPPGLRGHCLKTCALDVDCTAMNAFCYASGGMSQATCHVSPP